MMKEMGKRKKLSLALITLLAVLMLSGAALAAAPARVGGVKVSVGETSARIYWNRVDGCDGYYVYVLDVAKKKIYTMKIASPAITTRKIYAGNLRRLADYKVQVAAFKGTETGPRSGAVAFRTKIIPPFATTITLRSELKTKVIFTWTKSELAQYYELWRKIQGVDQKAVRVNPKCTILSCTMGHLKAGVTYTFYVRGVREYKGKKYYGPFSSVTTTPYTPANDQKLAGQINTNYAYGGGSNPTRNYSRAQLEAYVNSKNNGKRYPSANNYLIWCNTNNYHLYIFTNKNRPGGRWILLYQTPCIIGRSSHNTPRGFFQFNGRRVRTDYGSNHSEWISYFTGVGTNAVHSLLYPAQSDNLGAGYMASGGCIRVPRRYAKFIFDNCQKSTFIVR